MHRDGSRKAKGKGQKREDVLDDGRCTFDKGEEEVSQISRAQANPPKGPIRPKDDVCIIFSQVCMGCF